jgi:abortive infection bacteriophage resistance protein
MRTPAGYFFVGPAMKYAKPALSLDDQIALLEQRGLHVGDRALAQHALAHGNYYRLRGYWIVLEELQPDGSHRFRDGTSFASVLALSGFDDALRVLVMEAVGKAEVSLRTQFAYHIALTHGAHAYLDQALFHDPVKHAKCLSGLQEEISRSHEVFIKHYLDKYTDPPLPPLWVACEVMSLGSLSKWYENLAARGDRKRIADTYDLDETTLTSFMHHLTTLRNLCAHQCRLWNRRFTVTMKIPRNRPLRVVRAFHQGADVERRLFNSLTLLGHLMDVIEPRNDWLTRVRRLIAAAPVIDPAAMGFPADWTNRPLWRDAR